MIFRIIAPNIFFLKSVQVVKLPSTLGKIHIVHEWDIFTLIWALSSPTLVLKTCGWDIFKSQGLLVYFDTGKKLIWKNLTCNNPSYNMANKKLFEVDF